MNLRHDKKQEIEQQLHEERMALLIQQSMVAAAKTPEKTDDVLIPIIIMGLEDKRIMAHALTASNKKAISFQPIKAPETVGDAIQKSTGLLLGIGAIVNSALQSKHLADVAEAGISSAGTSSTVTGNGNAITNDSYKTGSQNNINGSTNEPTGGAITNTNTHANKTNDDNTEEPVSESIDESVDGE
jgi:hypothetical protein